MQRPGCRSSPGAALRALPLYFSNVIRPQGGQNMKKSFLTLIAAVGLLAVGAVGNRADAVTLGQSSGLLSALEDGAVAQQVHCRPGRLHHDWRRGRYRSDGCRMGVGPGPVIVLPNVVIPRAVAGATARAATRAPADRRTRIIREAARVQSPGRCFFTGRRRPAACRSAPRRNHHVHPVLPGRAARRRGATERTRSAQRRQPDRRLRARRPHCVSCRNAGKASSRSSQPAPAVRETARPLLGET